VDPDLNPKEDRAEALFLARVEKAKGLERVDPNLSPKGDRAEALSLVRVERAKGLARATPLQDKGPGRPPAEWAAPATWSRPTRGRAPPGRAERKRPSSRSVKGAPGRGATSGWW